MLFNCFKFILSNGPEVYVVFVALLLYMFVRVFYRTYLKQNIPEQKKLIPR